MTNQKSDVLNRESIVFDEVMNFGLKKYAISESKVETMMTRVMMIGKKLSNASIKASVMIPSGILNASPSLIGSKKIRIPNNEGMINSIRPDFVTLKSSAISVRFASITITLHFYYSTPLTAENSCNEDRRRFSALLSDEAQ